ncbi:hypothetical protein DICVIV_10226 [Dictyocaulus viviparus]|uniref:Uncharacterized protein n=1 Tax=Dictyocaulus viviparus TaxID=29172 RepID=A0A0D8XGM3_DICVI|nr:hypothetical protein DICVIV_10226 [Dictyocaulus viviparus]
MSVANSAPEGASPPPEPPPRDYTNPTLNFPDEDVDKSTVENNSVIEGDVKIRARLEACRQGMIQLEALRTKHIKLMQEMRGRLPPIPGCADVQARIKRTAAISDRSSLQSVDSGVSSLGQTISSTRCSSPSISHRSSVSCDSACSSVYGIEASPQAMPYSTYRKLSIEQKETIPQNTDTLPTIPIVATTIASTTGLRSDGVVRAWRRQQRPRSMYDRSMEQSPRNDSIVDTASFMQITPPPVHRKMGVVGQPPRSPLAPIRLAVNTSPQASRPLRTPQRPDIVKAAKVENADILFHASCVFVDRSPPQDRRQYDIMRSPRSDKKIRPKSMLEQADEPLYATPHKMLSAATEYIDKETRRIRNKSEKIEFRTVLFNSPAVVRKTAFLPVISRFSSSGNNEHLRAHKTRLIEKNWHESEGL